MIKPLFAFTEINPAVKGGAANNGLELTDSRRQKENQGPQHVVLLTALHRAGRIRAPLVDSSYPFPNRTKMLLCLPPSAPPTLTLRETERSAAGNRHKSLPAGHLKMGNDKTE